MNPYLATLSAVALLSIPWSACPGEAPTSAASADASSDVPADVQADTPPGVDDASDAAPVDDAESDVAGVDDAAPADAPAVDAGPIPSGPIGGDQRPAPVTLPGDYSPDQAWPLVVLLHGFSANGFVQDAYLGFSAQATPLGFIAVVPDGTKNPDGLQFWNAMPACCDFYGSGVDDEGYLLSLVAEAKSLWNVDPERVYFMGHSNGGYMSYRMACRHADVVAGVISIAGSSYTTEAECQPSQAVSALQVHGTLDGTVVYSGTSFTPGAQTIVDRWVARNNCTSGPFEGGALDHDSAVPGNETEASWHRSCDGGAEVGFWKMNGSGHVPTFTSSFIVDALTWLLSTPTN